MRRSYLNILAAVTILVGGWLVASPSPVLASSACCIADSGLWCCGPYCMAGPDSCVVCSDPEDCQN